MSKKLEIRPIFQDLPDNKLISILSRGEHIEQIGEILEVDIAAVCSGCRHHIPEKNTCDIFDSNEQAIIASEGRCALNAQK